MAADEAIILAGGFGTRLRNVVADVPKPLAPVAGRPFLAWLLDRLAAQGIQRCILATGYMAEVIEREIGTSWAGMQIVHSVETSPLGTGGAIRQAAHQLRGECAHVLNGDTWLAYSTAALEKAALEAGASIGLALAHVGDVGRYGAVETREGIVTGFREKGGVGDGWINAGCYLLTAAAIAAMPDMETFSFESEVLLPMAAAGKVAAWSDTTDFIDIGVPEDYQRVQVQFARA
jgi:D-glycero-alpha-D-manno-heptose 1-phosphate guanylyltransferase